MQPCRQPQPAGPPTPGPTVCSKPHPAPFMTTMFSCCSAIRMSISLKMSARLHGSNQTTDQSINQSIAFKPKKRSQQMPFAAEAGWPARARRAPPRHAALPSPPGSTHLLSFSLYCLPGGGRLMILQAKCSPVALSVASLTTEKPGGEGGAAQISRQAAWKRVETGRTSLAGDNGRQMRRASLRPCRQLPSKRAAPPCTSTNPQTSATPAHRRSQGSSPLCTRPSRSRPCASCGPRCKPEGQIGEAASSVSKEGGL